MKFNKKVPLVILIICLFLTVISVYQEHEKKALYGNEKAKHTQRRGKVQSVIEQYFKKSPTLSAVIPAFCDSSPTLTWIK